MGIGIRELIFLVMLFGVFLVIWLLVRRNRGQSLPSLPSSQLPVADRLAELESLRRGGQINADEYEKQRAAIISRI